MGNYNEGSTPIYLQKYMINAGLGTLQPYSVYQDNKGVVYHPNCPRVRNNKNNMVSQIMGSIDAQKAFLLTNINGNTTISYCGNNTFFCKECGAYYIYTMN